MSKNPLVSILVITYNSAAYVLETLESAKRQTYSNIELIISDDSSTDATIDLISKWLKNNYHAFKRTELVTTKINTGISANCNRGVKACNGDWIKLVAGDDILTNNCIEKNIQFALGLSSEAGIILSKLVYFNDSSNIDWNNTFPGEIDAKHPFYKDNINSAQQFYWLMRGKFLPGSAVFYHHETLKKFGAFDEKYPMIEDYPAFVKYTDAGKKIHFLHDVTVLYRKHAASISSNLTTKVIPPYFKDVVLVMLRYSLKNKKPLLILNALWNMLFVNVILYIGNAGSIAKLLEWARLNLQPARLYGINKIWKEV